MIEGKPGTAVCSYRFAQAAAVVLLVIAVFGAGCSPSTGANTPPSNPTASSQPTQSPESVPVAQSTPQQAKPVELKNVSYTKTFKDQSGYTASIKVTLWEPVPKDAQWPFAHPAAANVTLDRPADYDPSVNVVIPYMLTLTNTTKGFSIDKPRISYSVGSDDEKTKMARQPRLLESSDWLDNALSTTGWDVGTELYDAADYQVFGGGNQDVYKMDGRVVAKMRQPSQADISGPPSIEWQQPLAPGASDANPGFLVYHDKATPAEPEGSKWILSHLSLDPSTFGDAGISKGGLNLVGTRWGK